MRVELPVDVKRQMELWRLGLIPIPKAYIEFHKQLAHRAIQRLEQQGFEIHKAWTATDGWMDGMRVVWVIAEKSNKLYKLKWHDGNQEFFVQSQSGGGFPFREVN